MREIEFLTEKYPELPGSKPVESAVAKKLHRGEKGPSTKEARVETYLERIEKLIASGTKVNSERGWELLKHKIIKEFTLDAKDPDTLAKIAHGLYESEKKLAIERGQGAEIRNLEGCESELLERYKGLTREKRDIQERTLSAWLDYLKENDAQYPMWFRYFVVRNLQKMGIMEKEKGEYTKRAPLTVAPFPEPNEEALGFVYKMLTEGPGDKEKRERMEQLIAKKDFAKLYAFAQIENAGSLNRESLKGRWEKYNQGSNHNLLEDALHNKGTGWCTASGSAYAHLQGGDFYVYYTKGPSGEYTEPRVAIRMEGGRVAEVRGVNPRQEVEPDLVEIAQQKYSTLPGGERFDKTSTDMKKMTELAKKQKKGELFAKDDLIFLYEINAPIEGFGYQKDPRIAELRSKRDPKVDAPTVFDCQPQEIAWNQNEINQNIKAYIGPFFPNIFQTLNNLDHIYTAFPEQKIRKIDLEIGGKTKGQLIRELEQQKIDISDYARQMMASKDFTTQKTKEQIKLIRLKVKDLFSDNQIHTTDEIYAKAEKLGLGFCPSEVGPELRLKDKDQQLGDWYWVGMKQIPDADGYPGVFRLARNGDGLWLRGSWAGSRGGWDPGNSFVFRLCKLET